MATTIPVFSMGESASASQMNLVFSGLQAQGNAVLQTLSEIQLTTLVDYQRSLTALNARRQKAARALTYGTTGFLVSDFCGIDQGSTTATIRADTASATLRERNTPGQVVVVSTIFSSSSGTVQAIDANNTLFSVYNAIGTPTGTFVLTLASVTDISLLTVDVSAMASAPSISVSVSGNGLTWAPASNVQLSGYQLNAWLPLTPVKYVKVVMTPSHPDNLGGLTYTFGITDLTGTEVSFNLVSDVYFKGVTVPVVSDTVQLVANTDRRITYYLSLSGSGGSYSSAVLPNTPIPIPGVNRANWSGAMDSSGVLALTLPGGVIPGSISVAGPASVIPVVPGLSASDPNIAKLFNTCACLVGSVLTVLPVPSPTTGEYSVSYMTGPSSITVSLWVHLATSDSTATPIFTGAYLEAL